MITLVDYKAGNLTSVRRALAHLKIPCQISAAPEQILRAERIIFPGVGAAGAAMSVLRERGLDAALREAFAKGTPILGICIGCQIILEHSEEDDAECLGLLAGQTVKFRHNPPSPLTPLPPGEGDSVSPFSAEDGDFGSHLPAGEGDFGFPLSAEDGGFGSHLPAGEGDFGFPLSAEDGSFGFPLPAREGDFGFPLSAEDGSFGFPLPAREGDFGFPLSAEDGDFGSPLPAGEGDFGFHLSAEDGGFGSPLPAREGDFGFPLSAEDGGFGSPLPAGEGSGVRARFKIPHMGWNAVTVSQSHPVLSHLRPGDEFYFVHSYYPRPADPRQIYAVCDYGGPFPAAIGRDNLFAVQFHAEKSGPTGLRLLQNFADWNPA